MVCKQYGRAVICKTVYYVITEAGKTEITKETYLTLKESGQNVQMEEQEVGEKRWNIHWLYY